MQVTIPKVIRELLNSDYHSERIAGIRGLSQLATDNDDKELAQLAIEELKIHNEEIKLDIKKYPEHTLVEAGILPSEEQEKQAAEEKRPIDNIQKCHKLVEAERWRRAAECFQDILRQDVSNEEARLGFRRAWHGEEAALDFQQAVIRLGRNQLDDAYELLARVVERGQKYNFQIKGSQEILHRVGLHRELEDKRNELQEAKREEDWSKAVRLLHEIIKLDPKDEQAKTELEKAIHERKLQELYQKLVQNIEDEEWIPAGEKIREIENMRRDYRDIPELKKKVENNKRWEAWYSDIKKDMRDRKWNEAIETCRKIMREAGTYRNIYRLLKRAERAKKIETIYRQAVLGFKDKLRGTGQMLSDQWRKGLLGIPWIRVGAVVGSVLVLIFANQIAKPGDRIEEWLIRIRTTPTPTVALLGVSRVEVWMDGDQLDLNQLPSLTSGKAVVLEVFVVDTSGKTHTSDDLECEWSVIPLGNKDLGISTNLCKTLYIPSLEYPSQTVRVQVKGLEQQFEPGNPTSMNFEIVK